MEDVFDLTEDDRKAEIEVANREWLKKMHEVTICGQREALGDGFEQKSNMVFDKGLDVGFEAVKHLAVLKGRLLFHKSSHNIDVSIIDNAISEIQSLEADIIRELASKKDNFQSTGSPSLPSELLEKVEIAKRRVDNLASICKR